MNWSWPSGLFDMACSESPAGGVTGMSCDPVLGSLVLPGARAGNVSVTPGEVLARGALQLLGRRSEQFEVIGCGQVGEGHAELFALSLPEQSSRSRRRER